MRAERRVLVWMCLLVCVKQLGFGAMVPSLPLYARTLGVTASAIGLAVSVNGLAPFAATMPAGRLSDQLGRRHRLALGGLISAAGSFWCAEAFGFVYFIVARFIAGAGAVSYLRPARSCSLT
jgi:DHA1 family multidrug resistance protein-like MFS transporter